MALQEEEAVYTISVQVQDELREPCLPDMMGEGSGQSQEWISVQHNTRNVTYAQCEEWTVQWTKDQNCFPALLASLDMSLLPINAEHANTMLF